MTPLRPLDAFLPLGAHAQRLVAWMRGFTLRRCYRDRLVSMRLIDKQIRRFVGERYRLLRGGRCGNIGQF